MHHPPRPPTELPERVRVVVVFGGRSAEHDVSRISAAHVLAALDPDRYDVVPIAISRSGQWLIATEAVGELGPDRIPPPLGLTAEGTVTDAAPVLNSTTVGPPTVVLPVLHGPFGEDGTIQGLLELADVAYVGAGVLGSALSMDKAKAKEVLAANGIAQARFHSARSWELDDVEIDRIADDLGFPIFVKPSNMGSSVGVNKAADRQELATAVAAALLHDETVVFEEAVTGREIEIGVLGNEWPRVSVPGEVVPGADFYDYDDKYLTDQASLIIPAMLSATEIDQLEVVARAAYRALRCEGLARVDLFYEEGGRGFLLNEVNTFPGFTPISMFPRLWEASGLAAPRLLDEMIRLALDRHERRRER